MCEAMETGWKKTVEGEKNSVGTTLGSGSINVSMYK